MQAGTWHQSVSSFSSSKTEFFRGLYSVSDESDFSFLYVTAGFFLFTYSAQQLDNPYYGALQM